MNRRGTERSALVVTNLTKLAGLVLGVFTGFTSQHVPTMVLAGFMMAGAQVSESAMLAAIDRFFGGPPPGSEKP